MINKDTKDKLPNLEVEVELEVELEVEVELDISIIFFRHITELVLL